MLEENFNRGMINEIPVITEKMSYKMVAMRGLVVFPGQTLHFDMARSKSLLALNKAIESNEEIFLVAQKHAQNANPAPKDIHRVGTLCKIQQVLRMPQDGLRVLVLGLKRMEIETYTQISPYFEVSVKPYGEPDPDEISAEAVKRAIKKVLNNYKKLENKIPAELSEVLSLEDVDKFISTIATYVYPNDNERQRLLQIKSQYRQLEDIYKKLMTECEILEAERKISISVKQSIDKNNKDYYLREQIKAIKKELGEDYAEIDEFREKAEKKGFPAEVKEKFLKELSRMEKMSPSSPEASVSRTYLEWLLDVPWKEMTEDKLDLKEAAKILDEDHYGLEKVKTRILEYLAVNKLTGKNRGPILCFVGPPGVGKTSIVSSIARAAGKKMVSMSLGGVRDEAEIRGHRRTYIGALPGRIISAMRSAGVLNPVFLLDEIDKMSSDFRGDPASAMLEVLDANQNYAFRDHFLEVPYDLSNVMFVMTANTLDTIPPPLLDRMEVIELTGYTYFEKLQIAKKYLIPKQLTANGLNDVEVEISDDAVMDIITFYTRESGVRNLEREISSIARKIAVKVVESGVKETVKVEKDDIYSYLGAPKFTDVDKHEEDEVGLALGLAWTAVGGVTLTIEAALIPGGKGEITLTGSLGDVMKESCRAAYTYLHSKAEVLGIEKDKFTSFDVHLHFPEGATPKDGPSAGITITTALLSAMTGRKVRKDVAMTGEVTIRGKVLAIGGLKEKSLAAFRAGVKTLIIPEENRKDYEEIPAEVKDALDIKFVSDVSEVFDLAFAER